MKKKVKINALVNAALLLALMIYFNGLKVTLNIFYQLFKSINIIALNLYNTSILTFLLKHWIAFPIVGIILILIRSPRGKIGHYVGKGLYSIVGRVIEFVLNKFAMLIF